jgi:hypothetical protein
MRQDLDVLREEMEAELAARKFTVFHGYAREIEGRPHVEWSVELRPDFREFVAVAANLGVRLVVLHVNTLSESMVEAAMERLELSQMAVDSRRECQRTLERLRAYEGFVGLLQLSFDSEATTYVYEVSAPWYAELVEVAEDIDAAIESTPTEGHNPLGGYYSQN